MLFSRQDLFRILVPLILQQALSVSVGMLDSVMVSSAGEAAVSGVSLVNTINTLLIYVFSALATGGSVTISQALGAEDHHWAKNASKQLLWVVLAVSLLVTIPVLLFLPGILGAVFGQLPEEIMENARIYFLFTALSYPFLGLYNACAAIFRAGGNSALTLRTSLIMNAVNLVGNALLIYGFHWGAAGAAIATLFSRIVGAAIMLLRVCSHHSPIPVDDLLHFRPQWPLIRQICRIGIPSGIENGMFQFGKVITQSLVSSFGTVQIAANAAANSLTSLQYIPGSAIGLGMTVIVGRCIGAGAHSQAKHYVKVLLAVAYGAILVISIPLCVFSGSFVGMYHLSEPASALCTRLLLFHSLCVSTVWPIAFPLPNAFRAANDVRFPMIVSSFSMWAFRVGLSFVFGRMLELGVTGVWLAMACDWMFRAGIFAAHYLRGKWLAKAHAAPSSTSPNC